MSSSPSGEGPGRTEILRRGRAADRAGADRLRRDRTHPRPPDPDRSPFARS